MLSNLLRVSIASNGAALSSEAWRSASSIMRLISASERPPELDCNFCSLLVPRSLAETFRMFLRQYQNVTSICGTPRGKSCWKFLELNGQGYGCHISHLCSPWNRSISTLV